MTYKSTGVRVADGEYIVDGDLTLKGVTKSVPLKLELNGFGPDPFGGTRAGVTALGDLNRRELNANFARPRKNVGPAVGHKINVAIASRAGLQDAPAPRKTTQPRHGRRAF